MEPPMLADCPIPGYLNPDLRGNRYLADCPSCHQKKQAWLFVGQKILRCNRLTNCGFWGYVSDLWEPAKKPKNLDKILQRKPKKTKDRDRTHDIQPAIGKINDTVRTYLEYRLPGIDIEEFRKKSTFGLACYVKNLPYAKQKAIQGYELLVPLISIRDSRRIVSAQMRYVHIDSDPPVTTKNNKPLKILSMKGLSYGEGGATFGNLQLAMDAAKKNCKVGEIEKIIVVEGMMDFLTIRALSYDNSVGIAGASQALNVAQELWDRGWNGHLLVSLDGDEAGAMGVRAVAKKIADCRNIKVFNARPFECDLNDAYRNWGGREAIERILLHAKPIQNKQRNPKQLGDDKNYTELVSKRLWDYPKKMSGAVRDRYRGLITILGGKSHGLSRIAKTIECCEFKEQEIHYVQNQEAYDAGVRTRVAATTTCEHCVAAGWNEVIMPLLLHDELLAWPEKLHIATKRFTRGDIQEAIAIKRDICDVTRFLNEKERKKANSKVGKSLFVIIDVMRSLVITVTGAEPNDFNDPVISGLHVYLKKTTPITREDFFRDYLKGAYLSLARYTNHCGETAGHNIAMDQILTTKYERYYHRAGLFFPKQADVKTKICELRAEQRENEIELPENAYSVRVSFRERQDRIKSILAISWKPINFDNLTNADMYGKKMSFNPQDPDAANFLEEPWKSPRPVKDIIKDFWWIYKRRPPIVDGHKDFSALLPQEDADNKKNQKETLRYWNYKGYNPKDHPHIDIRKDHVGQIFEKPPEMEMSPEDLRKVQLENFHAQVLDWVRKNDDLKKASLDIDNFRSGELDDDKPDENIIYDPG